MKSKYENILLKSSVGVLYVCTPEYKFAAMYLTKLRGWIPVNVKVSVLKECALIGRNLQSKVGWV